MKTRLKLTTALLFLCTIALAQQKRTVATKSKLLTETVVTTQAKTEGGPIGGLIVKTGKTPCECFFLTLVTNKDGSFSANLEEGNYTISVNADELKKTILKLKREGERINGVRRQAETYLARWHGVIAKTLMTRVPVCMNTSKHNYPRCSNEGALSI